MSLSQRCKDGIGHPMAVRSNRSILVTGATGFLGYRVVVALVEAEVDVTALVHPDRADALAALAGRLRIVYGDVWNKASLKGRARGHTVIVHLVGSTHADPRRGLTHNQVNLVPTRNVTNMAIGDGVPFMVLLSTVVRPGDVPGEYVRSKRDAETYLKNSGLGWIVVRAPALYPPRSGIGLKLLGFLGGLWPLSILLGRMMPLTADIAANGIASLALAPHLYATRTIYANQLRRLARLNRSRRIRAIGQAEDEVEELDEPPFGWLPPPTQKG